MDRFSNIRGIQATSDHNLQDLFHVLYERGCFPPIECHAGSTRLLETAGIEKNCLDEVPQSVRIRKGSHGFQYVNHAVNKALRRILRLNKRRRWQRGVALEPSRKTPETMRDVFVY